MSSSPCYSPRLDEALALATRAFRTVRRKGTEIPYLSHLLQVMVYVAEHGGDEDQLIAALLHDYLEDVDGATEEELVAGFGARVAGLVVALSDATSRPKPPWRERKVAYLEHLRRAAPEVKLISAADKLHNARCIRRDLTTDGATVWERFSASPEQVLWYYREVGAALATNWSHALVDELRAVVEDLQSWRSS